MADTDERTSAFLEAANHLVRWAWSLPRWSDDGQKPWYVFLDRRYETDVAVIQRLRRAPNCRLKTCPALMHVELTLGGLSVPTGQGLAAAFQEWVRRAQGRVERTTSAAEPTTGDEDLQVEAMMTGARGGRPYRIQRQIRAKPARKSSIAP